MLDLKEISYQPQTGERKIIDNLNLKVHENEIILICGNSGSGKTTLLEIISGLTNPQKGKISWKNKILSSRQRRWFCGVVFQFPERYFIGTTIGKELKIGHKSLFFQEIFPFWGFVNPLIISSNVVLPEPLLPQIKMISFS